MEKVRTQAASQGELLAGRRALSSTDSGRTDEGAEKVVRKGPRWRFVAVAAILPALLLLIAGRDAPDSGERLVIQEILMSANVGTCSAAGTDSLVYGLTGYKLPGSAMTYKLKTASFPSYLNGADVQAAINSSFSAWDAATAKALFTNGGTTTAKVSFKDGTNTVGFGSLNSSTVGMAYGWADKNKVLIEFDITLSNTYTWSLNPTATGDCGGVAGKFDVRDIVTHEIGHPVGLADLSATSAHAQTMHGYAAYAELYKRDLAGGDIKGVTTLYGP